MEEKKKAKRRQIILCTIGLLLIAAGMIVLVPKVVRRVGRMIRRQQLLEENTVLEIPDLHIREPILEGTENDVLAVAAGHFPETGNPGSGNYCLAGHSSTIYDCIFNDLDKAETGMPMTLRETDGQQYTYLVSEMMIVNPDETWILNDFQDDRLTLVTCTDDGSQRLVVIGTLSENSEEPQETSAA